MRLPAKMFFAQNLELVSISAPRRQLARDERQSARDATPEQAFQGLLQLAQFASLLQQSDNGLTARTQLLDQIRMIPVNLVMLLLLAGFIKTASEPKYPRTPQNA